MKNERVLLLWEIKRELFFRKGGTKNTSFTGFAKFIKMLTKDEINFIMRETGILNVEDLSLYCVTYNVGGATCPDLHDVKTLFAKMTDTSRENMPDMVVVALQEMVDLNITNNVLSNSNTIRAAEKWLTSILQVVNEIEAHAVHVNNENPGSGEGENGNKNGVKYASNPYELVAHESMVGLYICLLCTHTVRPFFKNVTTAQCPRGINVGVGGGLLGNKGGVCIRFDMQDSSVCFVNAHMAAHRENVQQRNDDFHAILYDGIFNDPYFEASFNSEAMALSTATAKGRENLEMLRLNTTVKATKKKLEAISLNVSLGSFVSSSSSSSSANPSPAAPNTDTRTHTEVQVDGATSISLGKTTASPEETANAAAARLPLPAKSPARRGSIASIRALAKMQTKAPTTLILEGDEDDESPSYSPRSSEAVASIRSGTATANTSELSDVVSKLAITKPIRPVSDTFDIVHGAERAVYGARERAITTATTTTTAVEASNTKSAGTAAGSANLYAYAESDYAKELAEEERNKRIAHINQEILKRNTRHLKISSILDEEHRMCVDDHDLIIWLGDLNYRMTADIADEDVFAFIKADMTLDLASGYDQLTKERDAGNVFQDFNEGLLMFPPSYKYIPGSPEYDRRPEKKNRCPAWCDRILWRTRVTSTSKAVSQFHEQLNRSAAPQVKGDTVSNSSGSGKGSSKDSVWVTEEIGEMGEGFVPLAGTDAYSRYVQTVCARKFANYSCNGLDDPESNSMQLMFYEDIRLFQSDHRPVAALFNMRIRRIDWAAREKLLIDIMREYSIYKPNLHQKLHKGKCLVVTEPRAAMLYSNNKEFTQSPIEFKNTSSNEHVWVSVKEGSLPTWLRCTYTPTPVDDASAPVSASEWTQGINTATQYAPPVLVPAGGSIWIWITTDNVAAMMLFAERYSVANDLLKPLEEELVEVSSTLLMEVLSEPYNAPKPTPLTSNDIEGYDLGCGDNGDVQLQQKGVHTDTSTNTSVTVSTSSICTPLLLPVLLVLGPDPGPSGAPRMPSVVDSTSLLYRLNRMG